MSWFHDNKFLAIFGGVVLVGGGALGYLAMAAGTKYDEAQTRFTEAKGKLEDLYKAKPYPKDANVELYAKRQKEVKTEIEKLQSELAVIKVKAEKSEDVPPNLFQDRLKESVAKWVARAQEMESELPKEFYLGFLNYKDKPPGNSTTAVALLKELRSMELVMDLLLRSKGVVIKDLTREELKEEQKALEPDKKDKGAKAEKKDDREKLIRKTSFEVKFITSQSHFMAIMNGIAGHKEQIFVVRNLAIKNTATDSPPKMKVNAVIEQGKPVVETGPETVFGEEKVEATLHIDIADVTDPAAPGATATGTKGSNKSK